MMTVLRKTKPAAPAESPDVVPALKARLETLRQRGKALLAQEIALSAANAESVAPNGPNVAVEVLAQQLAAGQPLDRVAALRTEGTRLYEVQQERRALVRATELINDELREAMARRAKSEAERRGHEWRELIRDTALTICRLQRLNRDRARIAKEITRGVFLMPCEFQRPVGPLGPGFEPNTDIYNFLQQAQAQGIVTENEIARERGDLQERF
jgi:hypothetical protein